MIRPLSSSSSQLTFHWSIVKCDVRILGTVLCVLTCLLVVDASSVQAQSRAAESRYYYEAEFQTREAFRDVIAQARHSTVRLLVDQEQIALGVIYSAEGLIVTKASQGLNAEIAETSDGQQFPIKVIGQDRDRDLALLSVTGLKSPPIKWQSTPPSVGDWTVTVGTGRIPVAIGVISVDRRRIPASDQPGVMGIEVKSSSERLEIIKVFPESGAELAGLTPGDVVVEINSESVASYQQLMRLLRQFRPGESLEVRYRRAENEVTTQVTLSHPFGRYLTRVALQNQMGGALSTRRDDFAAVYQCDTVLRPEDCGGAAVDLDGLATGLLIARAGRTDTYILPEDLVHAAVLAIRNGQTSVPATEYVNTSNAGDSADSLVE